MPVACRLFIDLKGVGVPEPGHLRGFASSLFERGVAAEHHAQVKPYTIGRLASLGGGVWSLDVTVGIDALAALVDERMRPGTPIRLGPLSGTVIESPLVIVHRSWLEIAGAPPIRGVEFSFDTPVVFRRQKGQHAAPTPRLIFGHLRRRWGNLDPDTVPQVSFKDNIFSITLDGARIPVRGPGPRSSETGKMIGARVVGFTGSASIEIVEASNQERGALAALATAAPFLGMGSSTTAGFGATSLLAMWIDD